MQKYKNILIFLVVALVIIGCEKDNNSNIEASTSNIDRTNSIAGTDANNNGVRDDVDTYINTNYLVAPQRQAALQMARVIQREMLVSKTDKAEIKLIALAQSRAISCIYLKFDMYPAAVVGNIESLTSNTKERKLAYLAFSKAVDGTTSKIPRGDTCE